MTLEYQLLGPGIGVEVLNYDPRSATAEHHQKLYDLWLKYHVLVIRGLPMNEQELIAFGQHFGSIEKARKKSPLAEHDEIMVISNIRADGQPQGALPDGELYWHFDRIHQSVPNKAGVLHAIEVPTHGGETRFADMCQAWDTLPDSLKTAALGRSALNTYQYGQTNAENKVLSEDSPQAVHPVVRLLKETGRNALYICRLMTDAIEDMDAEAGQHLLQKLFDHSEQEAFVYEHQWQPGDTLIWDNRCVLHSRNDFPADQRRLLKRVTVGDHEAPILAT